MMEKLKMGKTLEEEINALSLKIAYELYKLDWCMQRGWKISNVQRAFDNGIEYNGQMFVCKDEFEECEYHDKEYIKYLFSEEFNKKLEECENV